jgi:PhzF family phenazine biosynthesis protein
MQAIANWTNLSETTFIGEPTDSMADYRLRIFTPRSELPFAGHPTIGSAHAFLRSGRIPKESGRLVQQCGKGLVEIRIDGESLFFRLPEPVFTPCRQLANAASALGIAEAVIERAAIIDVGPVWLTLQLSDARAVIELKPDMTAIAALSDSSRMGVTVFGFYRNSDPADIEVRSFAPADGVPEDPVCGSGNGCVAAFIHRETLVDRQSYVSSQGQCLNREGRVEVRFDRDSIWIGGRAVTCIEGTLNC